MCNLSLSNVSLISSNCRKTARNSSTLQAFRRETGRWPGDPWRLAGRAGFLLGHENRRTVPWLRFCRSATGEFWSWVRGCRYGMKPRLCDDQGWCSKHMNMRYHEMQNFIKSQDRFMSIFSYSAKRQSKISHQWSHYRWGDHPDCGFSQLNDFALGNTASPRLWIQTNPGLSFETQGS